MKGPVIALTTFSHIENNIKFHLFHMKTVKPIEFHPQGVVDATTRTTSRLAT